MVKSDNGKIPLYTVLFHQFSRALHEVAKASQAGHIKYEESDPNWDNFKTVEPERYLNAMLRHLREKDNIDEELFSLTGIPVLHAAQVAWNALAYLEVTMAKFDSIVAAVAASKPEFTVENVKKACREGGLALDDQQFYELWKQVQVKVVGKTGDNKNIYSLNSHFSTTKGKFVDMKQMHPNHIKNTLKKNSIPIDEIFNENSEAHKLLKTYFGKIIKENIKKLINESEN